MATYTKNTWNDGDIITADKLNNLENGILSIVDTVNTTNTSINDISNNVDTLTDTVNNINETVNTVNEQVSNLNLENITEILTDATESINENRAVINTNAQDISNIKARINRLENHVMLFSEYSDMAIIDSISDTSAITSDKKLVLSNLNIDNTNGDIWNVSGKGIVLTGCDSESVAIRLSSSEDVIMSDNHSTGELAKSISNAAVSINTNETVMIKDYTSSQLGYNGLEIGLNNTAPKKITIKNCDFTGDLSNNAISIFATADNCVVTIENCHFTKVSNVLRLSNRTNANNVKVNFVNCSWDHLDSNTELKSVVICQDYTSASQAETISANRFGSNKIEITFTHCTGEDGNIITLPEDGSWAGTGEGKLVYVYANKWANEESGKIPYADYFEMFPDIGVDTNL